MTPAESPEARAAGVLARLEERARGGRAGAVDVATLSDHLAMVRRWYYRPEKQRAGEVFFPDANGQWPVRRILNGAARVVLGDPGKMAETQRELAERNPADAVAKPVKTKVLHEGRPDVERVVPVVEKGFRSRKKERKEEDYLGVIMTRRTARAISRQPTSDGGGSGYLLLHHLIDGDSSLERLFDARGRGMQSERSVGCSIWERFGPSAQEAHRRRGSGHHQLSVADDRRGNGR